MEFYFMFLYPKIIPQTPTILYNNPTDSERHELLYHSLSLAGRTEDYQNIIDALAPHSDLNNYRPGAFKGIKVGIIGGGLAGMSAAFELRKLGYDITIFEPNERVGGRVYTYYFDNDKRFYGEFGAMRIPVSHETTWQYINLFKLYTEPFINIDPNTFTYIRGKRVRNDRKGENVYHNIYPLFNLTIQEKNTPWPELYSQVSKYYLSVMPPDVRKQILMVLPKYDYRLEFIENMSIHQILQLYGLSDDAINLIGNAMPMLGSNEYNSVEQTLTNDYSMDFLNLYRISGGMANLPLAFYKSLTSQFPAEYPNISPIDLGRINWKGGYYAYGIYKSDTDGKVVIEYGTAPPTFNEKSIYETFDYVICAFPMGLLREINIQPPFSEVKTEAIKDMVYTDAQKTLFLCKERFWEKQGIFGGSSYTDKIIGAIVYPSDHAYCNQQNTNSCSSYEPGILTASYNLGQDAIRLGMTTDVNKYRFICRDVEDVHGLSNGYLNNIVVGFKTVDWNKEIWAKGAFQMFLPGQRKTFLYLSSIPEYDNRVFFAGEHTSVKSAWMQGALQSGISAANNLAYYSLIHKYQR